MHLNLLSTDVSVTLVEDLSVVQLSSQKQSIFADFVQEKKEVGKKARFKIEREIHTRAITEEDSKNPKTIDSHCTESLDSLTA